MNRYYLQRSSRTLPGISRRLGSIMRTRSRRSASRLRAAGTVEKHRGAGPADSGTLRPDPEAGPRRGAEPWGHAPLRVKGPMSSWASRACARFANETFVYWPVGSNRA